MTIQYVPFDSPWVNWHGNQIMEMSGKKYDGGKDPWHLAPWDAFKAVILVMAFGAAKYGERNWEHGMDWSRLYSAALRHITSWWAGEVADQETGYSHLWHAACCIMFLVSFEIRGAGRDDRPNHGGHL